MNGCCESDMIEIGERAPDFVLPSRGVPTRFYGIAGGRPVALVFCGPESLDLVSRYADWAGPDAAVVAVTSGGGDGERAFPVLVDGEGAVQAMFLGEGDATARLVLLDPNLRVLGVRALEGAPPDELRGAAARHAGERAVEVSGQAPVLLIPGALDLETCARLVHVLETRGSVETGVERTREGRREGGLDPEAKRRRDHTVEDPELLRSLTAAVGRRVMPEVRKAFAFRATRFEGFKIACYDAAEGGYFRAHRDNLSPSTEHRRFALTLNLNEGYEGGHLRFPEYGAYLYRPGAGGAVVFSGSHLHEALPVTRGKRYVLLSFLFGEGDRRSGSVPVA